MKRLGIEYSGVYSTCHFMGKDSQALVNPNPTLETSIAVDAVSSPFSISLSSEHNISPPSSNVSECMSELLLRDTSVDHNLSFLVADQETHPIERDYYAERTECPTQPHFISSDENLIPPLSIGQAYRSDYYQEYSTIDTSNLMPIPFEDDPEDHTTPVQQLEDKTILRYFLFTPPSDDVDIKVERTDEHPIEYSFSYPMPTPLDQALEHADTYESKVKRDIEPFQAMKAMIPPFVPGYGNRYYRSNNVISPMIINRSATLPVPIAKSERTIKSSKLCNAPGCTKRAQTGGLCIRHGGGRRCKIEGCPKGAQATGRCKRHGGGARCTHPGCTKSSQGSGFCRPHGGGKRCKYLGCNKGQQKGGYCSRHGGHRTCQVRGCNLSDRGGGYCSHHKSPRYYWQSME